MNCTRVVFRHVDVYSSLLRSNNTVKYSLESLGHSCWSCFPCYTSFHTESEVLSNFVKGVSFKQDKLVTEVKKILLGKNWGTRIGKGLEKLTMTFTPKTVETGKTIQMCLSCSQTESLFLLQKYYHSTRHSLLSE